MMWLGSTHGADEILFARGNQVLFRPEPDVAHLALAVPDHAFLASAGVDALTVAAALRAVAE